MIVKKFLDEVVAEMKKVSWATRKEVVTYTGVVGVAVAVVCALIWICDTFFARLFHIILR
ncbi:preprotein translocase subunit SecE [Mitsuokella sp.]|uniref:preprotein translocase subunit SecE n=1 Tax=Mitsuokella TaxID=52225 RepID=UPI002A82DEF1|nr:preprotein translocase subunit SecE [Mitsuokella sp.]MDY4475830.1 preprotein translocase subunit SecE [Mitsuokella sp.]